jgi:choice-of-anchor B domain-containing protein
MLRPIILFCWLLLALLGQGIVSGQCGCHGDGCPSSCDCGCNDSGNSPPAGPPGMSNFESLNVELLSRLSLSEMGVTATNIRGNDCWGWTDKDGSEFAIFGLTNGTAFVDITDPTRPVYLGTLPSAQGTSTWRDIKVYNNRAYIVADGSGNANHGVQVFELRRLRNVKKPPVTFSADARFTKLGRAHNIAINKTTGFAYVVGSPSLNSLGGLVVLDLKKGLMPELAGVFKEDGYCHDTQVVTYRGPDRVLWGREIAFCSNENSLTIVDVTDKKNIYIVSRTIYPESGYAHQGWLSEDQLYYYMNDELDENQISTTKTRTHVWNVGRLAKPTYEGFIEGAHRTIDHNLYVVGDYIFQANYSSGLRILSQSAARKLVTNEVGFFDTYPLNNNVNFNGAWSVYPFFPSGSIIVSDQQNGLFVLRFSPP